MTNEINGQCGGRSIKNSVDTYKTKKFKMEMKILKINFYSTNIWQNAKNSQNLETHERKI